MPSRREVPRSDSVEVTTDVELTVARLRTGGLAAIPTETVYGLAADAEQPHAVSRIFSVKGRPANHPLIVHLASPEALDDGWVSASITADAAEAAHRLAATCWPGPLTMLVPRGPRALDAVTGGRATVGIRVPAHRDTQRILSAFGRGVAAPSANRFGRVSPTTAQHVVADIGALLDPARDIVFDGGRCTVGVESTIVDLSVWPPQVLRDGAVGADDIAKIIDAPLDRFSGPSRASGMLASHYAPSCAVTLAETSDVAHELAAGHRTRGVKVRVLNRTDDVVRAAFELYSDLRDADVHGVEVLIVVMPAAQGVGHAVRDRLIKAAAGSGRQPNRAD